MPINKYGVLKGRAIGRNRDGDEDHYEILIADGKSQHRIAVNVKSKAPNAPSSLLFESKTSLPAAFTTGLKGLKKGFTKLKSKPGGLALDYVRSGIVQTGAMKIVPPDTGGSSRSDLKDLIEDAVSSAMDDRDSAVYAFGQAFGPEAKADKYFHFKPGQGIHDIHMNQGNGGSFKKDNGVFQDGGLVFQHGDKFTGFFFAFQSQTFDTDETGNPKAGGVAPVEPPPTGVKRKRDRKSGGKPTKAAQKGGGKVPAKKAGKPVAKPVVKKAAKPVVKKVAKPVAKKVAKPAVKKAGQGG